MTSTIDVSHLRVPPAYLSHPEFHHTLGPVATDVAAMCGLHLDVQQQLLMDLTLGQREDGSLAARSAAIIAARQNLKTASIEALVLTKAFVLADPLITWTAHEVKTTDESFLHFEQLIDQGPRAFRRRVRKTNRGKGDKGFELNNGCRLHFRARRTSTGRGMTGKTVILDEALYLLGAHMGSLIPTMSTVVDAQVIYGSSACALFSEVLRGIRDRGRAGTDPRQVYAEWCAPPAEEICDKGEHCDHARGTPGCGCDKEENWAPGNPTLGDRLTYETLRDERQQLPVREWCRERMGWHEDPPPTAADKLPLELWQSEDLVDVASQIEGDDVHMSIDVTPDQTRSSLAVAGLRADGIAHAEVMVNRPGTGWVVPAIKARAERAGVTVVHLDGSSPAAALTNDLVRAGLEVNALSTGDLGQACGALVNRAVDGTLRHLDQPEVTAALEGAATRNLGDGGWAWARKNSDVDISPLVALTIALHALGADDGPSIYETREGLVL